MGQKINPIGFRVGINRTWDSRWYADRDYAKLLHQEDQILVGSRTFRQAQPASGTDVAQVADAFSQGLGTLGHDIAGWTLQTGQAHQQQAHRGAP